MILWILVAVVTVTAVVAVTVATRKGGRDRGREVAVTVAVTANDKAARMAVAVAVLAGVATVLLTVAAFVLSYAHLEGVAVRNGVPAGFHAWVWPGTIDTFIIIGELLIFLAAIAHLGFSWWGWGLTIGGSAGSIAFNVLGVGADAPPMQYAVAAAPPVAALFAFGALMHQVRRYVAVTVLAATATATATTPAATATMPTAVATDTVIPPRPTVAPVATDTAITPADMATDTDTVDVWRNGKVATTVSVAPRASLVKRVAGAATDTVTAVDKALAATDTAMMTALLGRPYTPAATATATATDTRTDTAMATVTPATPEVMAARTAMVAAMLRDDPTVDGKAVMAVIPGISIRTARRVLAAARVSAS
jgi:hypothetical protein